MARDLAHLSDEAVVALAARSDDSALAELYDRFGESFYGLALRMLRDRSLAQDAVQDVFLDVWRNAHRFMPERAKASTWIWTFAHRRAVEHRASRGAAPRRRTRARTRARRQRGRRERLAAPRARARAERAEAASGLPARGARARLLRRVHPVRSSRRGSGQPGGYHQEQDVHRPRSPSASCWARPRRWAWSDLMFGTMTPRRVRARRPRS